MQDRAQGAGKSSAVRILAISDEYYGSGRILLTEDDKKFVEQTKECLFYEAAELSGIKKAEVEHIKDVLARPHDTCRMAYGRNPETFARTVLFIGTANEKHYLRDLTGNRRFWPVVTGVIDLEGLEAARDQLFAEAAELERTGMSLTLDPRLWADAAVEQKLRMMRDEHLEQVLLELPEKAMEVGGYFRVEAGLLLIDIANNRPRGLPPVDARKLAAAMRDHGWHGPDTYFMGPLRRAQRAYQKSCAAVWGAKLHNLCEALENMGAGVTPEWWQLVDEGLRAGDAAGAAVDAYNKALADRRRTKTEHGVGTQLAEAEALAEAARVAKEEAESKAQSVGERVWKALESAQDAMDRATRGAKVDGVPF